MSTLIKSWRLNIDDILIKSKQGQDHLQALEEVFTILQRYKLRLKPQKCKFGVTSSKLLGFMVSNRGIKVDPKKVRVIISMPSPKNLKQLRSIQGKINSIRRFISQLGDKCRPFTHLPKKDVKIVWDEKYQKAFEDIKQYFLNHPILVPMDFSQPAYLYISTSLYVIGTMLYKKNTNNKKRAIYYLRKKFIEYEIKYTPMKKICYAMIFTTKKLRYYLLYCSTYVVGHVNPLTYLMAKQHISCRFVKWLMLLQEFDINVIK